MTVSHGKPYAGKPHVRFEEVGDDFGFGRVVRKAVATGGTPVGLRQARPLPQRARRPLSQWGGRRRIADVPVATPTGKVKTRQLTK